MPRNSDRTVNYKSHRPSATNKARRFLSISEPVFLLRKFEDHRTYTSIIFCLYCASGVCAWLLDYVSSPDLASETLWFRLASLWSLIAAIAILRIKSYRLNLFLVLACILSDLILSLLIMRHLNGELPGGVAVFAYFPVGATLICLGLSIRISLACVSLVSVLPPVLALCQWIPEFPYALYAMVIGPLILGLIVVIYAFAWNYHQRFLLERALEEASNTDALTGVANRRHFNSVLRREISRSERLTHHCALLMLDIDHFKKINDSHGHPTGDRVICAQADICTDTTRDGDWVARIGGEEFAILLPETNQDEALLLAERIRESVQLHHIISDLGYQVHWTVSIGVSSAQLGNNEPHLVACERLISNADTALYEAKNSGRNCVVCHRENVKISS